MFSSLHRILAFPLLGMLPSVSALAQSAGANPDEGLTLQGFGSTVFGRVGNGYAGFSVLPIPIPAGQHAVAVAAGHQHSLVLQNDGALHGAGRNMEGQLGRGTPEILTTPAPVATEVVSIAAGGNHSCFIKTDGSLWVFGANIDGQLGDGSGLKSPPGWPSSRPVISRPFLSSSTARFGVWAALGPASLAGMIWA
jgi:hypothetical protein